MINYTWKNPVKLADSNIINDIYQYLDNITKNEEKSYAFAGVFKGKSKLRRQQKQYALRQLGYYKSGIDGQAGNGSRSGIAEQSLGPIFGAAMINIQNLCFGYFGALMFAASFNYIPGLTDENGLAFGIFALDIYDDALHVASALWALAARILSYRAARAFLIIFGLAYLVDGIFGIFTGYGFLDLGIFTNTSLGTDWSIPRFMANLPHLALGGVAVWAGFRSSESIE